LVAAELICLFSLAQDGFKLYCNRAINLPIKPLEQPLCQLLLHLISGFRSQCGFFTPIVLQQDLVVIYGDV